MKKDIETIKRTSQKWRKQTWCEEYKGRNKQIGWSRKSISNLEDKIEKNCQSEKLKWKNDFKSCKTKTVVYKGAPIRLLVMKSKDLQHFTQETII